MADNNLELSYLLLLYAYCKSHNDGVLCVTLAARHSEPGVVSLVNARTMCIFVPIIPDLTLQCSFVFLYLMLKCVCRASSLVARQV